MKERKKERKKASKKERESEKRKRERKLSLQGCRSGAATRESRKVYHNQDIAIAKSRHN